MVFNLLPISELLESFNFFNSRNKVILNISSSFLCLDGFNSDTSALFLILSNSISKSVVSMEDNSFIFEETLSLILLTTCFTSAFILSF